MACQTHATLTVVLLAQDAAGVGHHGASLILSTTAAGASGTLQDWVTINSTGLASFAGELLPSALIAVRRCSLHLGSLRHLKMHGSIVRPWPSLGSAKHKIY